MMHQAGVLRASACAVTFSVVATVCAQDNQPAAAATAQPAAAATAQQPVKLFEFLIRVTNVQGACDVNNPDVKQFTAVQNNKAYPLGSVVRTGPGASALVCFSSQETVQLLENSEVAFAAADKNPNGRVVRLISGKIKTALRDNLPEGTIGVETPNVACKNVAGRGEFSLATDANAETFQAATITGSALVDGPQYRIAALRAANTVNIQTSVDRSLTRLTSVSGDFAVTLENGTETPVNYGMSPKAVVKIWRQNAAVGGRPVISTLVVSPLGKAVHRFAYAEGQACLTTGELIAAQEGDEAEQKKEELPVLLTKEEPKGAAPAAKKQPEAEKEKDKGADQK